MYICKETVTATDETDAAILDTDQHMIIRDIGTYCQLFREAGFKVVKMETCSLGEDYDRVAMFALTGKWCIRLKKMN